VAIFLPGFLLVIASCRCGRGASHPAFQSIALGVNASVVGLLLAAFYQPVWVNGILSAGDFTLAVTGYLLLASGTRRPGWWWFCAWRPCSRLELNFSALCVRSRDPYLHVEGAPDRR